MTLANKITVARIITVPLFVIALWEQSMLTARILFILCVASDAADGAIARWRGERTALGTFLDPLADKLLLVSTFITLTALGGIPVWVFIAVLSRDLLIVMGWSVVFILTHNKKIEPRPLGKVTTALQMGVAVALLFNFPLPVYHGILYAMVAATILSACDYVWVGNKRLGALE
jgi:cardiolipin synthase (CMP-forming)